MANGKAQLSFCKASLGSVPGSQLSYVVVVIVVVVVDPSSGWE